MVKADILKVRDKFTVGQKVNVYKTVQREDGKAKTTIKVIGKILGIYPNFLLIGEGQGYQRKESYTYTDIAITGCVTKR